MESDTEKVYNVTGWIVKWKEEWINVYLVSFFYSQGNSRLFHPVQICIGSYFRIKHANVLFSFPLCVLSVLDCKPLRVGGMSPLFWASHIMPNIILVLISDWIENSV